MLSKTIPLPGGSGWRMMPVRTPEWSPWPFTTTPRPSVRCGSRPGGGRVGAARRRGPGQRGAWRREPLVERPADDAEKRVELEGLLEEVEGAVADDAHGGLDGAVPRDHDDGHAGRLPSHALHQLDAVHLGHPDVDDGETRRLL